MDMSAAALPAISGKASNTEKKHPRYNEWQRYESNCRRLMINGTNFGDWLYQQEQNAYRDDWAKHPEFKAFQVWMRETQAGARKCRANSDMPYGLSFPENFKVWLTGERW